MVYEVILYDERDSIHQTVLLYITHAYTYALYLAEVASVATQIHLLRNVLPLDRMELRLFEIIS
jgi:hypothetical protein